MSSAIEIGNCNERSFTVSDSSYHEQTFPNLTLATSPIYVRILFPEIPSSFLANQVSTLSQALNNKVMAFSPTVDILDIISSSFKMAGCVVALGDEDVVIDTALQWLIERNGWAHELLLDSSETLKSRCELEVVVGVGLGNGGDNGNVVTLRADAVGT